MPAAIKNSDGHLTRIVFKDMSNTKCRFGRHLDTISSPRSNGLCFHVSFLRVSGLYILCAVAPNSSDLPTKPTSQHRCMAIHTSRSSHRIGFMSSADATRYMHRRLYIGKTRLCSFIPTITADAPSSLAHGVYGGCEACTEANANRQPNTSQHYKPSCAYRLKSYTLTLPARFVRLYRGGHQYALILVDAIIRVQIGPATPQRK
eukprot:6190902-Pleurochrysis_carterae.AAC.1